MAKTGRPTRPLRFMTFGGGCQVCVSRSIAVKSGYAKLSVRNRLWRLHRLVWTLRVGPIPNGYEVDHICRNKACVNIAHLRCIPLVQHRRENNRDTLIRKREECLGENR